MNETIVTFLSQFKGHQFFVEQLSSIVGFEASTLATFITFFVAAFLVVNVMALVGGLGTYAERKISADMQMRHGPNRVGPYGILQFLADGVKMLLKEDDIPAEADKLMFKVAPVLALSGVLATLAVLPFSSGATLTDLNVGIFYLLGVSSVVGVAVFLGGYSSNSKWSMLGGMRGASQIISYEVPITLSILAIVLMAGGLSFGTLVGAQGGWPAAWFIFHNPFAFIAFFVFFIGLLAETNRAPFDLPEAESELVSGYHTEYTGMRFAFFALAEYVEIFVLCGVCTALFLGGYKVPFNLGDGVLLTKELGPIFEDLFKMIGFNAEWAADVAMLKTKGLGQVLQIGSFVSKTLALYYVVIWIRWTLPRLRVDQLMTVCWKYLTPIALFNLVGCAVWMYAFDGKSIWNLLATIGGAAAGGH